MGLLVLRWAIFTFRRCVGRGSVAHMAAGAYFFFPSVANNGAVTSALRRGISNASLSASKRSARSDDDGMERFHRGNGYGGMVK